LDAGAVTQRRRLPPPLSAWVYELTPWGQELEPILLALGRWGARSPTRTPGAPLGVDSLVLSWRTMFSAERAAGFDARLQLQIDEQVYRAHIEQGQMHLERGAQVDAAAVLSANVATYVALVYEGANFNEALRAGTLSVAGDKHIAQRFLKLFPLPQLATPT
jgi:putative sterol carrier protein